MHIVAINSFTQTTITGRCNSDGENGQLAFNGAILCRYYFICYIIILLPLVYAPAVEISI